MSNESIFNVSRQIRKPVLALSGSIGIYHGNKGLHKRIILKSILTLSLPFFFLKGVCDKFIEVKCWLYNITQKKAKYNTCATVAKN